jgi:hypothetical protein
MLFFVLTTFGGMLILPYARLTGRAGNAQMMISAGCQPVVGISSNWVPVFLKISRISS